MLYRKAGHCIAHNYNIHETLYVINQKSNNMYSIRKIIKKIVNIYFYIGVNIIGLPEIHKHTIYQVKKIRPNYVAKNTFNEQPAQKKQ